MARFLRKEIRPPTRLVERLLNQYSLSFSTSQEPLRSGAVDQSLSTQADFHRSATGRAEKNLVLRGRGCPRGSMRISWAMAQRKAKASLKRKKPALSLVESTR